jgi:hypothetical protein
MKFPSCSHKKDGAETYWPSVKEGKGRVLAVGSKSAIENFPKPILSFFTGEAEKSGIGPILAFLFLPDEISCSTHFPAFSIYPDPVLWPDFRRNTAGLFV